MSILRIVRIHLSAICGKSFCAKQRPFPRIREKIELFPIVFLYFSFYIHFIPQKFKISSCFYKTIAV